MDQTPSASQGAQPLSRDSLQASFDEYLALAAGTDKVTDRRQSVNTLFVSINALFLTGVGYLLLQFFESERQSAWFIVGFLAIAWITSRLNNAWHKLSEQNRRMVSLRIRYLQQIEKQLRDGGFLSPVTVQLEKDEVMADGKDTMTTRGTYTLEDVLYSPSAKRPAFSFTRAEQQIGRAFTWSYWVAVAVAVIVGALRILASLKYNMHIVF
ncbi:MAG TPA: hypothetical protein VF792_03235 [Ktedonobacterales bacterium]